MHATAPTPMHRPTVVLTERGHAALAVVRLEQTLQDLDDSDRAYIVSMLRELLEDATA
jgi:hypothetical protein